MNDLRPRDWFRRFKTRKTHAFSALRRARVRPRRIAHGNLAHTYHGRDYRNLMPPRAQPVLVRPRRRATSCKFQRMCPACPSNAVDLTPKSGVFYLFQNSACRSARGYRACCNDTRARVSRLRACPDTSRRSLLLLLRVFERCANSQAPQPRRTKPGLPSKPPPLTDKLFLLR